MTILWCGGEDVDLSGGFDTSNTALFENTFSRGYIAIGSNAYSDGPVFTAMTNLWLHVYATSYFNTHLGQKIISLLNTNDSGIFIGTHDSITAKLVIRKTDNVVIASESGSNWSNAHYDINIINYGDNGTVRVYKDGSLVIDYTGDLTPPSGNAEIVKFRFHSEGSGYQHGYSQVILADEDTRLMRLKTLAPNAAGDTNAWTGAYTDIDETTISDSDKIYSATDNADFQCNLTGMPSGTWSVKAVKVSARCVDGSGTTGIQLGVKSGGTVNVGDTQTASGYWQTKERLMQVNPVTGVAFTPAEIEALQFDCRAKVV